MSTKTLKPADFKILSDRKDIFLSRNNGKILHFIFVAADEKPKGRIKSFENFGYAREMVVDIWGWWGDYLYLSGYDSEECDCEGVVLIPKSGLLFDGRSNSFHVPETKHKGRHGIETVRSEIFMIFKKVSLKDL